MEKNRILRKATTEDLDLLVEMENICFTDPWSKEMLASELESLVTTIWILEYSGEIVGYASLWLVLDEANINNIAIMPFAREKGHGQWLISQLISMARNQGAQRMMLEVRASNQAAKKLYEKNGFVYMGTRSNYYEDGEDANIMWLTGETM